MAFLPGFETARLSLRPSTPDDAREVWGFQQRCLAVPEALRFMQLSRETVDEVRARLEARERDGSTPRPRTLAWHARLRGDSAVIGFAGFVRWNHDHHRSEVFYGVEPTHRAKGIAGEALSRLLDFGWSELGLHRAEAHMDPENTASIRIAEKLGFVREGRFRESHFSQGRYFDSLVYAKLTESRR